MAIFFDSSKPFVENMKPFFAPGVSQAEIIATYNSRKDTYEKDNPPDLYKAPTITAEKTTEVVFNKCARILDVGSGTGLGLTMLLFVVARLCQTSFHPRGLRNL
ncbi:uncharacterized protein LOC102808374 [Saccoglossus kowalevskii]